MSGLVTASVLVALGDGFRSGADQALLYRTCLALDREDDFQTLEARTEAVALGALVALVLIGGLIVHTGGFAIAWLAETMLCCVGLAIACAMVEPPAHSGRTAEDDPANDSPPIAYGSLAMSIVPAALLGGAAAAASFLAQTVGVSSPANVPVLVATLTAAEAGWCALASRLPPATPGDQIRLASFTNPLKSIPSRSTSPSLAVGSTGVVLSVVCFAPLSVETPCAHVVRGQHAERHATMSSQTMAGVQVQLVQDRGRRSEAACLGSSKQYTAGCCPPTGQ